jgi:hypothetical protein
MFILVSRRALSAKTGSTIGGPMLLTISTTHNPATVLAGLLQHHLDDVGMAPLPFGQAMVCFSQADEGRCTAAVMVQTVYEGPTTLGVSVAEVFSDVIHGYGQTQPGLADQAMPFEVGLPVLFSRGGPALVRRLFEPLGYDVSAQPVPYDAEIADDAPGEAAITLTADIRATELLSHVSLLLPVLDDVSPLAADEEAVLDPLLVDARVWIARHPAAALINHRYAQHDMLGDQQRSWTA